LPTFLGNHDMGRIGRFLAEGGAAGDELVRRDRLVHALMYLTRGDLVGTDATTAQESFDTAHPLYRHLADVSALREEHPALADGAQLHRIASGEPGIYAFSRISDEDDVEYLVAANNAEEAKTVSFDTFGAQLTYRGLWPSGTDNDPRRCAPT
jgi:alpha-amylase